MATLIQEANDRVRQAQAAFDASKAALDAARTAAAGAPNSVPLQNAFQSAGEANERAKELLEFEESERGRLVNFHKPRGFLAGLDVATVIPYVVFTTMALVVLIYLMMKMPTPAMESTPRGMIAFLIAVVTVGIALILVLSTIVSGSSDRANRFSQGKEVLTALLGILGTIVGFYFGTSQDERRGALTFDPVVVAQVGNAQVAINTAVRGGTTPYHYSIVFTAPAAARIPEIKRKQTSGPIAETVPVPEGVKANDLYFRINVEDDEKRSGSVERKPPS